MPNIIQNFNDTQLNLISNNDSVIYNFNELSGDYVKLTLYNSDRYIDVITSNGTPGFDVYRDESNNIYIKTNEILDENLIPQGNYELQFDFLRNIFFNFQTVTAGGCNSPEMEGGDTLTEDTCELLGACTSPDGPRSTQNFVSELECCGADGSQCSTGDDTILNSWEGYTWTSAEYESMDGYDDAKFYIKEISPSRKEVRLIARNSNNDSIDFDSDVFINNFADVNYGLTGGLGTLNEGDQYGDYGFDYVITLDDSKHIPIINWTFDPESLEETTIVIRMNEPLPVTTALLTSIGIEKQVLPKHQQNIYYISNVQSSVYGGSLSPDSDSYLDENTTGIDNYQNYNQLLASASINNTDVDFVELQNNNDYKNININFSDFSNHVIFGSAKSKILNFKNKVKDIENNLNELSESLHQTGSHITSRRKSLFSKILTTKKTFTPYEKFLYYGNDSGSYSAPNIGSNMAHKVPVNMQHSTELNDYDGFRLVYNTKSDDNGSPSNTSLFNQKYFSQDAPFYNYSSSIYLSFLVKAPVYANNNDANSFQWGNTNKANSKLNIPQNCQYRNRVLEPTFTGSEWRRFIFESSQSYWRPTGSAMNDEGQGDVSLLYNNFDDTNFYEVLSSAEKVFSASISGSTGTGYPIVLDDTYNEFGTFLTSSGNPFTGSMLPAGEYFNLRFRNNSTNAVTSSFITDIKITLKNPDKALPFGEVYSTSSAEWQTWYNKVYEEASSYDDTNIHSLKNNLPSKIIESVEYENLHTFVNMWGEQFDLIRNYIDNYSNFYKRGYGDNDSVPDNLLPILSDNLGWELINPFSGSLSEYYSQFSGSEASNKKVSENLWKRNLNNLIYIYKTKGTSNSLSALLNCLGYPSELLNVNEFGGVNYLTNQALTTETELSNYNNFDVTKLTGNHSDRMESVPFKYLNLEGNNSIPLNWGSSAGVGGLGPDDTIEFMFLSKPSNKNQELVSSYFANSTKTESFWDIKLLSGSSAESGSIQFRINSSVGGNGTTYNTFKTGELPIKDGTNFVNVMLRKSNLTSPSGEYSASFDLTVAKKSPDGKSFSTYEHKTNTLTDGIKLANWTSSAATHTTGNFIFGRDFTGSLAEVRVWSGSLSESTFRQHVLNPSSIVGNQITDSQNNLYYRFKMSEQIETGSTSLTINDSNPYGLVSNPTDFTKTIEVSESFGQMSQKRLININRIGLRNNPIIQKNTRMISVSSGRQMIRDLNPKKESLLSTHQLNKEKISNTIELFTSPIDKINDYILDNVSAKDISAKYSKWSDKFESEYEDLESFKKLIMRGVSVDVNEYIKTHAKSGIYNPLLLKSIKKIIPERVKYDSGIKIKNTLLDRTKIEYFPASVKKDNPSEGTLKHPFYVDADYTGKLFDFDDSKKQNIYGGTILDITSEKGMSLNNSIVHTIHMGTLENYMCSASFRKSKLMDIHEVSESYNDYYNVGGEKSEIYGYDDTVSPRNNFILSSTNETINQAFIYNKNILKETGIYNENHYDSKLTLDDNLSTTGENNTIHLSTMTMVDIPQFTQTANVENIYTDTINLLAQNSSSGIYNENTYNKNIDIVELHHSSSGIVNENVYKTLLNLSSDMNSASGEYYDTNNKWNVSLNIGKSLYNYNGFFRDGTLFKDGATTLLEMWGTGSNDLHFYDPLNHLPGNKTHNEIDSYNNIYRYESQRVFEMMGDVETISSSIDNYGMSNVDYTDKKFFENRQMSNFSNVDKEYNYISLLNDSSTTHPGRPMGRTRFVRNNNGVLEYPSNHVIHSPGLREYQLRYLFNHTRPKSYQIMNNSGNPISASKVPSFKVGKNTNAQYDVNPTETAYSIDVGGSNTSKTITITKK
tara:strand:- start:3075 stop:8588 length:5514 start_codon:yes stop_codon:yes gene_type:complete